MLSREVVTLSLCVAGIYASFLTWAILQERITTTPYGPDRKIFRSSLVINVIQSFLAGVVGFVYCRLVRVNPKELLNVQIVRQLCFVALTQSLASPCSYASLRYVDYITLLLAKSCKLLPVMLVQVTYYRRTYPLYKYLVVLLITVGVALFTFFQHSPQASSKTNTSLYGLALLGLSLILDGMTNSTQDDMFHRTKSLGGPHMMLGLNFVTGTFTLLYLVSPFTSQLQEARSFISMHPSVLVDILLFAICGALGQIFIFYTLHRYGSMVLVTVTVTRKMMSMLLSVFWFNHTLSVMQWLGVSAVFAGISAEALYKRKSKTA